MKRKFKLFAVFVMIVVFALLLAVPEQTHASKKLGGKKDTIPVYGDICDCEPPNHVDCYCLVADPIE
jgi:hypothetical protein